MIQNEAAVNRIICGAEEKLRPYFDEAEKISQLRTASITDAYRELRLSEACLSPSTGYGYGDRGRETLEAAYAHVFGCEAALVRHGIANGTHALAIGLFGLLRTGDTMLAVTGEPYDTLLGVIGKNSASGKGSLADFGIKYKELPLSGGHLDHTGIRELIDADPGIKVVYAQRSRGYSSRPALSVSELDALYSLIDSYRNESGRNIYVVVDNCYGEFTEQKEPRADLLIGSLIKNPGGGLALSGGYLAGSTRAVELASYRYTTPGVGGEVGATIGQNRNMIQGFFMAPHTVLQAKKTAMLAAAVFEELGFIVSPRWDEPRSDIIETITLGSAEALCAFCRGIQAASPIDAYVTPEPWDMPGYADKVIMAAGTFVSGASIELSADGPLRPPYTAYMQGSLTYESGRLAVKSAALEAVRLI